MSVMVARTVRQLGMDKKVECSWQKSTSNAFALPKTSTGSPMFSFIASFQESSLQNVCTTINHTNPEKCEKEIGTVFFPVI